MAPLPAFDFGAGFLFFRLHLFLQVAGCRRGRICIKIGLVGGNGVSLVTGFDIRIVILFVSLVFGRAIVSRLLAVVRPVPGQVIFRSGGIFRLGSLVCFGRLV